MLHHACIVRGPQRQARGGKSEVAASPLLSRSPKRGRKCYATPALSEVPNAKQGANSEVAASPLLSRRPKKGRKCYATLAFSGVPNAKRRGQNQRWLPHHYFLGGQKEGGNATSPLHSRGSPTPSARSKVNSDCLTSTFSGAQKREEMLRHPCILRGPQHQARGAKSEVAASSLLSRRPKRGRKCYVTLAFSGVPNAKRREQNQKWLPHPYFVRGQERAEMLHHSCILGGPQHQARGAKSEVAASTLLSRRPKRGRKRFVTLALSGVPNAKRGEQN